eukprot:CAMPEP_0115350298 /NCGR_PEP_ID=MMETSP0270-20121206/96394_1 /TAXON_ID=71861 /ORGANISM="Scrippsiella trochoidea, Strain CCMP3099" /LENGTH=107 /DNA_ID=CAMNT_0002772387 /DNA_START=129 /DNA_END=452 /DNA_ORIENTATION=+
MPVRNIPRQIDATKRCWVAKAGQVEDLEKGWKPSKLKTAMDNATPAMRSGCGDRTDTYPIDESRHLAKCLPSKSETQKRSLAKDSTQAHAKPGSPVSEKRTLIVFQG